MKRRLLNVLTPLSLLVCLAAVTLWVRSYSVESLVGHTTMRPVGAEWYWRTWNVRAANGYVQVLVEGHRVRAPEFADQWAQRPGKWEVASRPLGGWGRRCIFRRARGSSCGGAAG